MSTPYRPLLLDKHNEYTMGDAWHQEILAEQAQVKEQNIWRERAAEAVRVLREEHLNRWSTSTTHKGRLLRTPVDEGLALVWPAVFLPNVHGVALAAKQHKSERLIVNALVESDKGYLSDAGSEVSKSSTFGSVCPSDGLKIDKDVFGLWDISLDRIGNHTVSRGVAFGEVDVLLGNLNLNAGSTEGAGRLRLRHGVMPPLCIAGQYIVDFSGSSPIVEKSRRFTYYEKSRRLHLFRNQ